MKKELRPVHDVVTCDVCGRTILKGERTEAYLAPGGHRHQVCDLCAVRAQHSGWIRESAAGDMPQRMPRSEPRGGLLGRMRRRRPEPEAPGRDLAELEATYGSGEGAEPAEHEEPASAAVPPPRARTRPKDPAPRAGGAHHGRGEDRPRARPLQRLRPPAHDRRPGPHAGQAVRVHPARRGPGQPGVGGGRLGAFVVSLSRGSWRRGRPRDDAREGRRDRADRRVPARLERDARRARAGARGARG